MTLLIRTSGLLTVACALLLTACNLGPRYARPQISAPANWTPVTTEDQGWPEAKWWHGFGSSELDQLITQAQLANDDVKAAIARIQQSDAQARIAGAPLLPALQAGFTPNRTRQFLPVNGG